MIFGPGDETFSLSNLDPAGCFMLFKVSMEIYIYIIRVYNMFFHLYLMYIHECVQLLDIYFMDIYIYIHIYIYPYNIYIYINIVP